MTPAEDLFAKADDVIGGRIWALFRPESRRGIGRGAAWGTLVGVNIGVYIDLIRANLGLGPYAGDLGVLIVGMTALGLASGSIVGYLTTDPPGNDDKEKDSHT